MSYYRKQNYIVSFSEAFNCLLEQLTQGSSCQISSEQLSGVAEVFKDFVETLFNLQMNYDDVYQHLLTALTNIGYTEYHPRDLCDVLITKIMNEVHVSIPELLHVAHIKEIKMINRTDVLIGL